LVDRTTRRLASTFAIAALVIGCGARTALRLRDGAVDVDAGLDASLIELDVSTSDAHVIDCRDDPTRCEDHDVCTTDACTDGTCAHVAISCDDGDACTDDACDGAAGCTHAPHDCDDHDVCTTNVCTPTLGCESAPVLCDDGDPCTANLCDPTLGCTFPPIDCHGCADGVRDGFRDLARYGGIAACAGGFQVMGLSHVSAPTCARGAGNDGTNPDGVGCSATDLCAPGWHVCLSESDVAAHSPDGCMGASDAAPSSFFATRQTGPGCGVCATGTDPGCGPNDCRAGCAQTDQTTNDIFGCGSLGDRPDAASCGVLDRFSNNLCSALAAPWRCDADPAGLRESDFVVKPGSDHGGVLCCTD